jgi:hypothetical protein
MGHSVRFSISLLALSCAALTGCNMETTAPTDVVSLSYGGTFSGRVHGGQQPVGKATVELFSTGTSGYGAGSTLRATTTTDNYGNFSFTKSTTNSDTVNSGSNSWACPTTGDPQILILATGGNTQGPPIVVDNGTNTTTTTSNNPAVGLLAAIGDCASISSSTYVQLNELTTVASAIALSSYISPGATAGAETFGTGSSTQATVGLNNAVAGISNLVSIANGTVVTPQTYSGTGTASGITVTATAESSKLVAMGDILASCINSTNGTTTTVVTPDATGVPGTPTNVSSTSTACNTLLGAATPPTAAYTSQSSGSFPAATDTIQAALYMTLNPTDSGTTYTGCTSNISCLYNLQGGVGAPFQTGLSSQPNDWTVGVTYTATGTCTSNGAPFITAPYRTAIDASGNIFFIGSPATYPSGVITYSVSNLSEISPIGQPLACLGDTTTAEGRSLSIDPSGNVWAAFNASSTTGVQELAKGASVLTPYTTADYAYGLVADKSGNVIYQTPGGGGTLYKITSTTASTQVATGLYGSGNQNFSLAADSSGNIWGNANVASLDEAAFIPSGVTYNIQKVGYSCSNYPTSCTALYTWTVATGSQVPAKGVQFTTSGFTTTGTAGTNDTTLGLNSTYVFTVVTSSSTTFTTYGPHNNGTTISNSSTGSGVATTVATYDPQSITASGTQYGIALDSSSHIYTGVTGGSASYDNAIQRWTVSGIGAATAVASTPFLGGNNGVRSLTLDGAGNLWAGLEYAEVGDATATGNFGVAKLAYNGTAMIALSPSGSGSCGSGSGCPLGGGFYKNDIQEARDLAADPSGNLWVMVTGNQTGTSPNYENLNGAAIVEIVGAAVPTATPLSAAAAANSLAGKP